ncbi:hypothetical protein BJV77DRAFT_1072385, partial [Russula vinacea]
MDSQAIPLRHYSSAKFLFDRESPFAPLPPKKDTPTLASQTSSQSSLSSPSPLRTQHRYCLTNGNDNGKGNDQPWLTLLDTISGVVELDLAKPETVREVKVTLKGETTLFTEESHTFLDMSSLLTKRSRSSGKLSGKHSYPFSFVLPDDKGVLFIDYKIVATVRHGLFSVDNSGRPVAAPTLDPGGWKLLPRVKAAGTLAPNAIVTAQLSIANPLSFALGTPIPLFLEFHNDGTAYIDPYSIDVRLVRTLTTRGVTGGVHKLDVARAAFWPAPGSTPRRIKLWGEVIAGK